MPNLKQAINKLVIANRILATERVLDAYGHVSVRHPNDPKRYLLARSLAPELIEHSDIHEYTLDGHIQNGPGIQPYLERFIHAAVYEARPEVAAVVHSHAPEVLGFTISSVPLRPVFVAASHCGANMPVWDIADRFGDTTLLVSDMAKGRDLAALLEKSKTVLMRGHGFTSAGTTLEEVVRMAIFMPINARMLLDAIQLGGSVKYLSPNEIKLRDELGPGGAEVALRRGWEYWAHKAGCAHLLNQL